MKGARVMAVLALGAGIFLAFRPEVGRYAAMRDLAAGQGALVRAAGAGSARPDRDLLAADRDLLESARNRLPFDPRPSFLLGSNALLRNEPVEALLSYQESLALEERPETDLNLSRTYERLGNPQAAANWALRAAWLSPSLVGQLPAATQDAIARILSELEAELAAGSKTAIPARPTLDSAAGQNHR
jgi:hypothetical protein